MTERAKWGQEKNRPLEKWEWLELYNLGMEFGLDPNKDYSCGEGKKIFRALRVKYCQLSDRNAVNVTHRDNAVKANALAVLLEISGGTIIPIPTKSPEQRRREVTEEQLKTLWPLGKALGIRFDKRTCLITLKLQIIDKLRFYGFGELSESLNGDTEDLEKIIERIVRDLKLRPVHTEVVGSEFEGASHRQDEEPPIEERLTDHLRALIAYSNFVGEEVPPSALGRVATEAISLKSFLETIKDIKGAKKLVEGFTNQIRRIAAYWKANQGSLDLTEDERKVWDIKYNELTSFDLESCQLNYNPERPDDLIDTPCWTQGGILGFQDRCFRAMAYRDSWQKFEESIDARQKKIRRAAEDKKKQKEPAV